MEWMGIRMTSTIGNVKRNGAKGRFFESPLARPIGRASTAEMNRPEITFGPCTAVTLIELLAVIGIIGLLTLLGLPIINKFSANVRLKSAQSQIASILRMAQNLSVTKNTSYTVNIFPRNTSTPNRITITKTSGGAQEEKIWTAPSLIEIPDVTGVSGSVQTIVYSPYGTATPAASIHIIQKGTLVNASAYDPAGSYGSLSKGERVKCFTITSDNTTGRTEVYNYGRNSPWSSSDL
jgi:type II secretory pathway pseudopilin PulG